METNKIKYVQHLLSRLVKLCIKVLQYENILAYNMHTDGRINKTLKFVYLSISNKI
jgi:hypothetical protein